MIRMRQIVDHKVDRADGWQFHEWLFSGESVRADRTGRRNPHMVCANWLVVICNNSHCRALAIISKEDLLGMLPPAPESKPLGVAP